MSLYAMKNTPESIKIFMQAKRELELETDVQAILKLVDEAITDALAEIEKTGITKNFVQRKIVEPKVYTARTFGKAIQALIEMGYQDVKYLNNYDGDYISIAI